MFDLPQLIAFGAVFMAALILGRWFDKEKKRVAAQGRSWYAVWATAPGILIIVVITLLILIRQGFIGGM